MAETDRNSPTVLLRRRHLGHHGAAWAVANVDVSNEVEREQRNHKRPDCEAHARADEKGEQTVRPQKRSAAADACRSAPVSRSARGSRRVQEMRRRAGAVCHRPFRETSAFPNEPRPTNSGNYNARRRRRRRDAFHERSRRFSPSFGTQRRGAGPSRRFSAPLEIHTPKNPRPHVALKGAEKFGRNGGAGESQLLL